MLDATSSLANVMITRFLGSFNSTPAGDWNLEVVLRWIKDGMYAHEINEVRQVLARHGKAAYDRAKAHLPAFTFGGTFHPKRGNLYLQQHSTLVLGDLDNLSDIAATKRAICSDPRTVGLFISPSAIGLKVLVYSPEVVDDTTYKYAWSTIRAEYEQKYRAHWDPSGKDVSRLCYASFDPDCYINFDAARFDVPPPPVSTPQPTPTQATTKHTIERSDDYAVRAIKTAVQMIETAAPGVRHHTRLRASRLLGGYVAGQLITHDQAYTVLKEALRDHTEDLDRALKTVEDGLRYGEENPIKIEDLEAEQQAWIESHPTTKTTTRQPPTADDPWEGRRTLPLKPYQGLRLGRTVRRG
jgi:hypothetical protein